MEKVTLAVLLYFDILVENVSVNTGFSFLARCYSLACACIFAFRNVKMRTQATAKKKISPEFTFTFSVMSK